MKSLWLRSNSRSIRPGDLRQKHTYTHLDTHKAPLASIKSQGLSALITLGCYCEHLSEKVYMYTSNSRFVPIRSSSAMKAQVSSGTVHEIWTLGSHFLCICLLLLLFSDESKENITLVWHTGVMPSTLLNDISSLNQMTHMRDESTENAILTLQLCTAFNSA